MAGDSVLAVFETATGAASAALAIQGEINPSADAAAPERRMLFRIGVHLGDVIEKPDGTVYGDGVNIAARLEGLAEPGGITVSDSIRIAVKGKVAAVFEDQGEQSVKNIADPVRAWRVLDNPRALADAAHPTNLRPEAGMEQMVVAKPAVAGVEARFSLPDKPSIAVLPFTNMSGDPQQEYFADGMVEDIITELSRFQRLFVIARNTSFTYKGKSVDVKRVAGELGVHFVLEGSVRKAGNRVRITAQLINGETGQHVWAERYEDVLSDVFELQERITRQVVGAMVPEMEAEEMRLLERGERRFTEVDDIAWRAAKAIADALFRGEPALALEAAALAERAIDLDEKCYLAWRVLASSHTLRVFLGWAQDRAASLAAGQRAAERLMMLAPNDGVSYFWRGWVAILSGDFANGAADQRRAHALNPNDKSVLYSLSWIEASAGNIDRARELAELAIRMSPKDRQLGTAYLALAMCAFIERDWRHLHDFAVLAIQTQPAAPIRRVLMIAYAAEVEDKALLSTHLDKLQGIAPDFIPGLFRGDFRPFYKAEQMAMLLDSLRKAGLGE